VFDVNAFVIYYLIQFLFTANSSC